MSRVGTPLPRMQLLALSAVQSSSLLARRHQGLLVASWTTRTPLGQCMVKAHAASSWMYSLRPTVTQ